MRAIVNGFSGGEREREKATPRRDGFFGGGWGGEQKAGNGRLETM